MLDVICAGQAVIDCITRGKENEPYKENVYRAGTIRLHTGGDAVNEAMALAGMGIETAVVCGIGKDMAGDIIVDRLSKAGVRTDRIRRCDMDTPIANLMVSEDGSRVSVNSKATGLPGYRILPEELFGAKIVSFASLFRPPLADPGELKKLILSARAYGSVICCDTKLPLGRPVDLRDLTMILPLIDYLFPNEKEAAFYTGRSSFPEMAGVLHGFGVKHVIIKAGAEGCFASGEGRSFTVPAEKVENVVDTTGAGDNFVAGFLSGILRKQPFEECAAAGIRQAARVITHTGGA